MATFVFRRAWRPTERVRIEGSAAVVDAALAAGVRRLVQESVSMIYPDRGDEWIDESVEPDPTPNSKGNLAAEASATRVSQAGGTGIVLRLGLFYGPGARHSEQFLTMARHHVVPLIGKPETYLSSIHVVDGGEAVAAALHVAAGTTSRSPSATSRTPWPSQRASGPGCVAQACSLCCSATGWLR